ncbi:MAG: phage portal protein [Clostridia bacterium]
MALPIITRMSNAWNVFRARDEVEDYSAPVIGYASSTNPAHVQLSRGNERSLLASAITRIAIDVSSYDFRHVIVDADGNYVSTHNDPLNQCLTVEANPDQTGRAFIQDVITSMFDEGCVALVPIIASKSPILNGSYDIYSLRTGKIVDWYPTKIRVEVYNELLGIRERILMPKSVVGIIENPLYAIMNEPNSTFKRLIAKLNLLDNLDRRTNSGKLDIIIQLPYTVRSEAKQEQAKRRIKDLEDQMSDKKYGIGYVDATERITQLNRPVENNLLAQIQYLTVQFYDQLGMSEDIFTGKADTQMLQNYYDRSIEPIVMAVIDELNRKFLTKTARTQGHSIMGFRDVFRLMPANELANTVDVLSRNEILTSNEIRQILGRKPSDAPHANELRNKNMPIEKETNPALPQAKTPSLNTQRRSVEGRKNIQQEE